MVITGGRDAGAGVLSRDCPPRRATVVNLCRCARAREYDGAWVPIRIDPPPGLTAIAYCVCYGLAASPC